MQDKLVHAGKSSIFQLHTTVGSKHLHFPFDNQLCKLF